MQDWYRGCALVFQTIEASSILASCSNNMNQIYIAKKLAEKYNNASIIAKMKTTSIFEYASLKREAQLKYQKELNHTKIGRKINDIGFLAQR